MHNGASILRYNRNDYLTVDMRPASMTSELINPDYRLITTVNSKFVPLLKLWLEFAAAAGVRAEIAVYCFDDDAYAAAVDLKAMGGNLTAVRFRPASEVDTMRDFIVARFSVFQELLHQNIAFVHTDLDAFWLADPLSRMKLDRADAVFSRAHGWPMTAVDRWGFTLCGGWFALRPGPGVRQWFTQAAARLQRQRSDQKALAEVLLDVGVNFIESAEGADAAVELSGEQFSVHVIPDELIARADQPGPGSLIYHPVLRPAKYLDKFIELHRDFWKSGFAAGSFVEFASAALARENDTALARLVFDKLVASKNLAAASELAQRQMQAQPGKSLFWKFQLKSALAEAQDRPDRRNLTHLANAYGSDKGTTVAPRHDYAGFYEVLLNPLRDQSIRFLEIGLQKKGSVAGARKREKTTGVPSVDMWLDFFPQASIYGFDRSDFSAHTRDRFCFVRGDLSDRSALERLKQAAPSYDVVLDDGSHASWHQLQALCVLASTVRPGGLYIIEDLHHQPAYIEAKLPAVPPMAELLLSFRDNGVFPHVDDDLDEEFAAVGRRISDIYLLFGDSRFANALKVAVLRMYP